MTHSLACFAGLRVPVNGTVYLRLTAKKCTPTANDPNSFPTASILKLHHYYGMRPRKTTQYAYFQQRDWSVYMGMGQESSGFAIAGKASFPFCPPCLA